MFKKLLVALLGLASIPYLYAFNVTFNGVSDVFEKKLVGIHFFGGWNNYGWVLFVTKNEVLPTWEKIFLSWQKKECNVRLRWYYYNPLHGSILYPLDESTLKFWYDLDSWTYYSWLYITWGFYTACSWDQDSIYWQILYKKDNKDIFSIIAWVQYDYTWNKIIPEFAKNFQVLNNYESNVIGLIYDSSSWIWFVWGHLFTWEDKIVNYLNTGSVLGFITNITSEGINNIIWLDIKPVYGIWLMSNLTVVWVAALSKILFDTNTTAFLAKRTMWNHTLSITTPIYNISTVLNNARTNVYKLCMGKWNRLEDLSKININNAGAVICIKWDNLLTKVYDDLTLDWKVTTIIVKWKNNKLLFLNTQQGPWYVNVFVDNGEVLFSNNVPYNVPIGGDGDIDETTPVTSWYVFNGNIIINWILAWSDDNGNIEWFKHKFYYHGSLASLNTLWDNAKRKNLLESLGIDSRYADLIKWFTWECTDIWKWTDGVNCSDVNDKYATSSFVILKKQYENPLVK